MAEKLKSIPQEEINRRHEEALEINKFIDELLAEELMEGGEITSAQRKAEHIIAGREILKEKFGKGWGEKMVRDILSLHPAIKKVEQAAKETDEQRETDAFIDFEKGKIGVQITLTGFEERDKNNLREKLENIVIRGSVTYRGEKEVLLTMLRSEEKKFLEAFSSWNADGRKDSLLDYLPRKDALANEFIKTMALVFEYKHKMRGNYWDQSWAEYLLKIYEDRKKELEKIK